MPQMSSRGGPMLPSASTGVLIYRQRPLYPVLVALADTLYDEYVRDPERFSIVCSGGRTGRLRASRWSHKLSDIQA